MSDRAHSAALHAARLVDFWKQKKAIDGEIAKVYAAARSAGWSRLEIRNLAAKQAAEQGVRAPGTRLRGGRR